MPGIVDRGAAAKGAAVVGDNPSILTDDNAIGIGVDVDRTADSASIDRISVVVEAHEAGLRD